MLEHPASSPLPNRRRLFVLSCLSFLILGAGQAGALPKIRLGPAPGVVLVQAVPPDAEQKAPENSEAAFTDLNQILEATRTKLDELFGATAMVAGSPELREELQALRQQNERLAAGLQQARAERESSSEQAEARIAELSKAIDAAAQESGRNDDELAELRRQNAELNQSLARAQGAREAAQAEAEKAGADMAAKLQAASDAAAQSKADVAGLRKELEATRRQLATASDAREQSVAQVSAMEQAVERSGTEAERLKTEMAAVKEQLGQAAGAAVEAERSRQTASNEADSLRDAAARARRELAAAKTEIARFKTANTELEKQVASWRQDSKSAIETARYNLIVMEQKIEELNAALGMAQPEEAMPEAKVNAAAGGGRPARPEAASATARAAAATPARGAAENSGVQLSMAVPSAAPPGADPSELARFQANIADLNERALDVAGVDLFSGIESVGDRAVHVSTTTAWDSIPPAGQLSYLNSLLDYWVAAQGGKGPAVVRIVDRDDQVLLEKSWP